MASLKALIPRRISADGGADKAHSSPETRQSSFQLSRPLVFIPCKLARIYRGRCALPGSREIKLSEAGVSLKGPYLILAHCMRLRIPITDSKNNSRTLSIEDIVLLLPAVVDQPSRRHLTFPHFLQRSTGAYDLLRSRIAVPRRFQGNTELVSLNSTRNGQFRQFPRVCTALYHSLWETPRLQLCINDAFCPHYLMGSRT